MAINAQTVALFDLADTAHGIFNDLTNGTSVDDVQQRIASWQSQYWVAAEQAAKSVFAEHFDPSSASDQQIVDAIAEHYPGGLAGWEQGS